MHHNQEKHRQDWIGCIPDFWSSKLHSLTHTKKSGFCLFGISYPLACLGLPIFPIAKQVSQFPMISTEITSLHVFFFVICISIPSPSENHWGLGHCSLKCWTLVFWNKVSSGIPWNQRNLRYPLPMVLLKILFLCQRWDMFRSLKVIPEVFWRYPTRINPDGCSTQLHRKWWNNDLKTNNSHMC